MFEESFAVHRDVASEGLIGLDFACPVVGVVSEKVLKLALGLSFTPYPFADVPKFKVDKLMHADLGNPVRCR